jgi:hypothetical protein
VGTFAEWVMVRVTTEVDIEQVLRAAATRPRGNQHGWAIARTDNADAAELTARLAAEAKAPALGGWVYDSDFAYLVGNDSEGGSFEALLGQPYKTNGDPEYAKALERLASEQGRRESAEALSNWSQTNAARAMDPEAALRIIEAEFEFVEDGLAELFEELALPALSGILDEV